MTVLPVYRTLNSAKSRKSLQPAHFARLTFSPYDAAATFPLHAGELFATGCQIDIAKIGRRSGSPAAGVKCRVNRALSLKSLLQRGQTFVPATPGIPRR